MRCEYCVSAGCMPRGPGVGPICPWPVPGPYGPYGLPFAAYNASNYTAHVFLLLSWLSTCLGRGPHHPHGHHTVEHKHHHYKPSSSDSLTSDTQILHDKMHLEEDSKVLTAEALAKMTPEELEFHYFSSHDYDRNSKLDGLEMLKAVYHTIQHSFPEEREDDSIEPEATDLEVFVAIVDRTLQSDDTDGDGYVSYSEYRAARINNTDDRTPRIVNQV